MDISSYVLQNSRMPQNFSLGDWIECRTLEIYFIYIYYINSKLHSCHETIQVLGLK